MDIKPIASATIIALIEDDYGKTTPIRLVAQMVARGITGSLHHQALAMGYLADKNKAAAETLNLDLVKV